MKHTKPVITTKNIMGIFDFFKRKQTEQILKEETIPQPIDNNSYLIEVLKSKLLDMGYEVERNPQYLTLIVNSELEISTVIIDVPGIHPYLMQIRVLTAHPLYFPNGIDENLAGAGETIESKIDTALDNYLNSTFMPIIAGFSDSHDPEVDLLVKTNESEVLWHPKLGNLMVQGQWELQPEWNYLFDILKDKITGLLKGDKFNWLKIYISKRADGTIIGECLFNNQPWDSGLDNIVKHAESWNIEGNFKGLKQFIMFRRCDLYDK
jgi:hypothetical protein